MAGGYENPEFYQKKKKKATYNSINCKEMHLKNTSKA